MLRYLLLGVLCWTISASAQQYGPLPPRPQQFAGATLIQPARGNFRPRGGSGKLVSETAQAEDQSQFAQGRRPQPLRKVKAHLVQPQLLDQQRTNLIEDVPAPFANKVVTPTPLPQFLNPTSKLTPRPVEEEVNEDEEVPTTIVTTPSPVAYTVPIRSSYSPAPAPAPVPASPAVPVPGLLQSNQIPSAFQRPQFVQPSAFRPTIAQQVQPVQFATPAPQGRQLIRQQVRPVQGVQAPVSRQPIPQAFTPQVGGGPIQGAEEEQYFRQVQNRPTKKQEPAKQPLLRQPEAVRAPAQRAQTEFARPQTRAPQRERKPVAQTIRKYHEEHEDGSITWGYENDDGSFKEETIGVDCVTRGKYGYYDPDGVKREYTYQTGIPCDRAQESEEAASNQGFIDYTNNKYVLPNGDEIDLEAMVKNRARKPVTRYVNRT